MGFITKVTTRLAKTASAAATESVKAEVKTAANNALPTLVGIGFAIAGLVIFRSSLAKGSKAATGLLPMMSRTSVVTNNFFFSKEMQEEVLRNVVNM